MYAHKMSFMVLICLFVNTFALANKSVFIISKHSSTTTSPSIAQAWAIDGNSVAFQGGVDISSYSQGFGAVGNAVWPEKNLMFVTYENSGTIVWTSTKTLQKVGEFDTGVNDLAGVAVDSSNNLIYIMQRNYPNLLYLYAFDEPNNTLDFLSSHNLKHSLGDYVQGMGLALDEVYDKLYVSAYKSNRVHYYNTDDFVAPGGDVDPSGHIDIVVNSVERKAVGIAVDPVQRYMYTGGLYGLGSYHTKLVRTRLDSPHTSIEVGVIEPGYPSIEYAAIGLGVEPDTGYVYVTTTGSDFRVYDHTLKLHTVAYHADIDGPAGVAVGGWYKKPVFSLTKDNNDPNDECVQPWNMIDENYLVFDICWDANGYADTNVTITDYLPAELDYYSSVPAGDYNSAQRSVTWDLGAISGSESNCFVLTTKVNEWARPGGVITNNARIEGDEYLSWDVTDTNICAWGTEIIYVDKDANGYNNGTNWDDAYTDLQDGLTGARNCGAAVTAVWVAAGTYKPTDTDDKDAAFELPGDVAIIGHFGGIGTYETGPDQRDLSNPANETVLSGDIGETGTGSDNCDHVVKTFEVDDVLLDGVTIAEGGYAGALCEKTNLAVVNCIIKNNRVATSGTFPSGGIHCDGYVSLSSHNCVFSNNDGYSLYLDDSSVEASYTIFDGNENYVTGIYLDNSVANISNSVLKNLYNYAIQTSNYGGDISIDRTEVTNNGYGLDVAYGNVSIDRSIIELSYWYGISCLSCPLVDVSKSIIRYNGTYGVELQDARTTTITNTWIHDNGYPGDGYNDGGIYLKDASTEPLVTNNTIVNNLMSGLYCDSWLEPNMTNCILYDNDAQIVTADGLPLDDVTYSCIEGGYQGMGNIGSAPSFVNPADPNDYHIAGDSPCKDTGDPNGCYSFTTDIDGEERICYGRIDIGADEYYYSAADYDKDGIVNFIDFAFFADDWGASLDLDDLTMFCVDWLWQPAWAQPVLAVSGVDGPGCLAHLPQTDLLETLQTAPLLSSGPDDLMMLSLPRIRGTMPEQLWLRTQRFYVPVTSTSSAATTEEPEPLTNARIKELIEWTEQLLETDDELKELVGETRIQIILDSLKAELEN